MGVPSRRSVPRAIARRPDQNHQPAPQVARGDKALFAVVTPVVGDNRVPAGEYLRGVGEIEAALRERQVPLGRVDVILTGMV